MEEPSKSPSYELFSNYAFVFMMQKAIIPSVQLEIIVPYRPLVVDTRNNFLSTEWKILQRL